MKKKKFHLRKRINDPDVAKYGHGRTLALKTRMRYGLMDGLITTRLMFIDLMSPKGRKQMRKANAWMKDLQS